MRTDIKEVIKIIKKGGVVVCPTDTVYGLITDATNKKAVEKIFKIKKRDKKKAIPIFVKDIKTAKNLAFINEKQEKFLRENWPGKITVILKRKVKCGLPEILFSKKKTIGLRIPNYKLIKKLLQKTNKPLTGTSANISRKPPSTKIKEVLKQFSAQGGPVSDGKDQPDLIIDVGNLKKSRPSRVIDLTKNKQKILRI
ncbi:MAG: threonylcarbamoyl-AMP synthase [Candidatus Nealsonbacteria bacterium CG10_big_fil_rev_8_21_14_0_10_36_24]|uniref:L-threonylcarbamoyladenylate synthase n=2 Tax=Candidatus Nealsoniibacteriota TaxID=1817911 RepID=A0A2H0YP58_9BACT|nr:MAG: threonylcarbamoyl-AMP synthase [Candidatus Nealsonbacteria bacterium CG10_big_fil_rev_8_21_14_0_10_36_24]PIS40250.1 MAG: threonylcarbamoyl-AMP synthase [Candidatus Nealsonbacteria bacterium CG08_land_8_20_14_0_20_36_22]